MSESKYEQIELYLSGELNEDEKRKLDREIDSDPQLKKEFRLRKEINQSLQDNHTNELRKSISRIFSEEEQNKPQPAKRSLHYRKWQLLAATLLILIASGAVLYVFWERTYSMDKLYSLYYQPDDAIMIVRSGDPVTDKTLIEALDLYDKNQFEEAIELLEKQPYNSTASFYLGLSYLEIDETDKAIAAFQRIIDSENSLFSEQAHWFLGLSFLKKGEREKAIEQFKVLSVRDNFYSSDSKKILKHLE